MEQLTYTETMESRAAWIQIRQIALLLCKANSLTAEVSDSSLQKAISFREPNTPPDHRFHIWNDVALVEL